MAKQAPDEEQLKKYTQEYYDSDSVTVEQKEAFCDTLRNYGIRMAKNETVRPE